MNQEPDEDSILLCASDLQHAAIFDNYTELRSCVNAVAKRLAALSHPKSNLADSGVIAALVVFATVLDPRDLHVFLQSLQAGEMSVSRAVEILDMWLVGKYSDDQVPPPPADSALIVDDKFPMELVRELRAELADLRAAAPVVPAPGAKPRLIGWRTSDFLMETADKAKAENWQVHHEIQPIFEGDPHTSLKPPEVQAAPYAQLSDQSVVMVVAFDEGVKEPRIVSWNKFTVGKHRLYAAQPPQQSAQPVAWMHETPGRVDVIHDEVKKLLSAAATDYLHRPIDKSEKYTIPLYAAAQPVEVQRVPLTDATQFEKDVARWMEKDGLTREQAECEVNYRTTRKALKSGLSAHGIKPTSSEGGA